MSFEVSFLLSLSVAPGAVLGWLRFKKTGPAFLPFLLLLTAGLVTEVCSYLLLRKGYSHVALYNFFSLAEVLLISRQFYLWGLFDWKQKWYRAVLVFSVVVWVSDNVWLHPVTAFGSFAMILHSFIIVIMSIHMINRMMFTEVTSFLRHSVFCICIGFIIYFTYAILVEMFWIFGLNRSSFFRGRVYDILAGINFLTNIIYLFAIVWMPMKPRYITRY